MTNPFDVEDDKEQTARLAREVKEKAGRGRQDEQEQGDLAGAIEVSTEPEEDDDDERPQVGVHQEKKRERVKRFKEEKEAALAEAERLRQENVRLQAQQAAIETTARMLAGRNEKEEKDPSEERLTRIRNHKTNLYNAFEARRKAFADARQEMPNEELDGYKLQVRQLEDEEDEIKYERYAQKRGLVQRQQANPQVVAAEAWLNMEHPDVMGNPDARRYAVTQYEALIADGNPAGKETVAVAMNKARHRFGMNVRPGPTNESRAIYRGTGSRGPSKVESNGKVVMTEQMQDLAMRAFPKMKPKDAITHWAKTVGPNYLASRSARERKRA